MRTLYLLLIIISVNNFFYLLPIDRLPGGFRVSDIGILLTLVGAGLIIVRPRYHSILINPFSLLIFVLLLLCGIQAGLTALNYGQ
ncbi:MAG: hypothetical protein AAGA91_05850, partial [Pseudomonadota bacterium]